MTIADMSKAFNDPQRKAYKTLSTIAEVTGVDIVLYASEADGDGMYQLTIAGGFAPTSETADIVSRALGNRTVMTGSVSRGHENASQSLQMTERPLMSPDELKSMRKGSFIVMRTGAHPFISRLKLFLKWGIRFDQGAVELADKASRTVHYAGRDSIIASVAQHYPNQRDIRKHSSKEGGTVQSEHHNMKTSARYWYDDVESV